MSDEASRRERQILNILFELGEASADDVRQQLDPKLANPTVRTMLRKLEAKGLISHREDGQKFLYKPTQSRRVAGKSALRCVLDIFYDGSVEHALAAHFLDSRKKIDSEELARLRDLIDSLVSKETNDE